MIEHLMSKRRIFEIYLNIIEWGNGVFGAQAAARYYYGINAANLSAEQAARIAAMVPKPRFYDRVRDTPLLERRTAIILERMYQVQVP
jgi:monofunctional biosynthetic peptidoglycan transglycosylase